MTNAKQVTSIIKYFSLSYASLHVLVFYIVGEVILNGMLDFSTGLGSSQCTVILMLGILCHLITAGDTGENKNDSFIGLLLGISTFIIGIVTHVIL